MRKKAYSVGVCVISNRSGCEKSNSKIIVKERIEIAKNYFVTDLVYPAIRVPFWLIEKDGMIKPSGNSI